MYIYSYWGDVSLDAQVSPLVSGAPAQRSGPRTSQSYCTRALGRGCLTAAKTALQQVEAGCRPRGRCKLGRSGSALAAYFRRSSAGLRHFAKQLDWSKTCAVGA